MPSNAPGWMTALRIHRRLLHADADDQQLRRDLDEPRGYSGWTPWVKLLLLVKR